MKTIYKFYACKKYAGVLEHKVNLECLPLIIRYETEYLPDLNNILIDTVLSQICVGSRTLRSLLRGHDPVSYLYSVTFKNGKGQPREICLYNDVSTIS